MALELEPVGIIFTEIRFMNHHVERRAKLQRNRKIFRQKGKFEAFISLPTFSLLRTSESWQLSVSWHISKIRQLSVAWLNPFIGPNPAEMNTNVAAWSRLMKRVNTANSAPGSSPQGATPPMSMRAQKSQKPATDVMQLADQTSPPSSIDYSSKQ